jgi:uncharacterized protein
MVLIRLGLHSPASELGKASIMLNVAIVKMVELCARRPWLVLVVGIALATTAAAYDAARFSITTDTENLIAQDLPWCQREVEFSKAFPVKEILVVVTAPTLEEAAQATNALEDELSRRTDLFKSVGQPDSGKFFQHNGLMFEPLSNVKTSMAELSGADVLVNTLAADPSLLGVVKALDFAAEGVRGGEVKLDQLAWPLSLADKSLNDILAGRRMTFSWQALVQGYQPQAVQLRHFIEVQPVLDYSALQPGRAATDAIHQAAANLKLGEKFGATVELTGPTPLNDSQFSVIRRSVLRDTLTALLGTLIILWLALRSWKIVVAVYFGVMVGLAVTAALGLAVVGAFNLLSIAFFVLFVGLGVDFGIQFSVRYRSERHKCSELHEALKRAAREVAAPLTLAAGATAVAFFSFLPTNQPVRVGQNRHRRIYRSRHSCPCCYRGLAPDCAAAGHRRALDLDPPTAGRSGHAGNMCVDAHCDQFRQHHRVAAAARRRRRVQDLLHPGVA